jgi:hypothetical protein
MQEADAEGAAAASSGRAPPLAVAGIWERSGGRWPRGVYAIIDNFSGIFKKTKCAWLVFIRDGW